MTTLTHLSPLYIASACATLLVIIGVLAAAARLRSRSRRTALRLGAAFLLLRLLLVGNPFAWNVYARLLSPYEVGWRQHDAIRLKGESFLQRPEPVRYLAVGSSQTAVIYDAFARERDDVGILAVAAMQPMDFTLYRRQIERYGPERILLYLSDFDIARRPSAEALLLAPPQWLGVVDFAQQLGHLPDAAAYTTTLAGMLAGELFPEYRYRFVFRGLAERVGRRIAIAVARPAGPRPRPAREDMIAAARESLAADYIPFNMLVLRDFIRWARGRSMEVVIVEGHYNPVVLTPEIERASRAVRRALEELADSVDGVTWVPRQAVMEFTASDYTDLSHVTPEAGHAFAGHLIDVLERNSPSRRASLRR